MLLKHTANLEYTECLGSKIKKIMQIPTFLYTILKKQLLLITGIRTFMFHDCLPLDSYIQDILWYGNNPTRKSSSY